MSMIDLAKPDAVKAALLECLPPSERDLDAFRMVRGEQKSTREVAKLLKISQTRVRQIVDRVVEYMLRLAPEVKDPARQNQRLYLAEALGLERMKCMYREAMRSFRRSRGQVTVTTETPGPLGSSRAVSRTTESQGDVKYLQSALRISWMMAKVPDNQLINTAYALLEPEETEGEGQPAPVATKTAANPLVGDCSADRAPAGDLRGLLTPAVVVRDCGYEGYVDSEERGQGAGPARFAPAHLASTHPAPAPLKIATPAGMPAAWLRATGEEELLPELKPASGPKVLLSRRERRARERLLKKAKGKRG